MKLHPACSNQSWIQYSSDRGGGGGMVATIWEHKCQTAHQLCLLFLCVTVALVIVSHREGDKTA